LNRGVFYNMARSMIRECRMASFRRETRSDRRGL
jgi:hypothetical protein